jgi:APA family basic amino acid/polyamine antiporter
MVSYKNVDINAPLSRAFQDKGMTWAAIIISAGSVSTLTSTTFASLLGQPRIFYQMSVDVRLFAFSHLPCAASTLT